jgi:hypothetical protein
MSRIYTSVVTVGNVNIYQVSGNPDGSLEAPQGSLAIDDAAALYQNTDGGTSWSGVGGGGYYQGTVILRETGPVDASNVYATAEEARLALAANPGVPKQFIIEAFATLTAGAYGDSQTTMAGRPAIEGGTVFVAFDGDVDLSPMFVFENLYFIVIASQTSPAFTLAGGGTYTFRNCEFGTQTLGPMIEVVGNTTVQFVDVNFAASSPFGPSSPPILIDSTVSGFTRLSLFCSGSCDFTPAGPPIPFFDAVGANSFLTVRVQEGDYFKGDYAAVTTYSGTLELFTLTPFGANRSAAGTVDPTDSRFICGDGTVVTLPALADVPDGYSVLIIRDESVGADATVNPAGADVLYPTDPILLAQGEAVRVVKFDGSFVGTSFWATVV